MRTLDKISSAIERQLCVFSPLYDKLFYFPGDAANHLPPQTDLSHVYEEFIRNDFGDSIHVWRLACASPRLRVIHFHGSGYNMSSHYPHVSWLTEHGCEVIMFDYPGYGKSTGVPTRRTTVRTAYEVAKKYSEETDLPTFVLGQSLGGNIASVVLTEAPRLGRIRGAVLDSMYSSFKELGAQKIQRKFLPKSGLASKFLSRFISDSDSPLERAHLLQFPLLILHSRNDGVVSFTESVNFYRRVCTPDVEFASHLDSGHTDVLQHDLSGYRKMVLSWMEARKSNEIY